MILTLFIIRPRDLDEYLNRIEDVYSNPTHYEVLIDSQHVFQYREISHDEVTTLYYHP